MNEELLIELLEPFQIERFKKVIKELPEGEVLNYLIRISSEIAELENSLAEFEGNGYVSEEHYLYMQTKEFAFHRILRLYFDMEAPLILNAILKTFEVKIQKYLLTEYGNDSKKSNENNFIEQKVKSIIRQFEDALVYYQTILRPFIQTLRKNYLTMQPEDSTSNEFNIEPLKWDGLISQFAELLYEIKKKHDKKKILLNASYNEIAEHFVFWNDKEQAYKKISGDDLKKYVGDVTSSGNKEKYKWIRDIEN